MATCRRNSDEVLGALRLEALASCLSLCVSSSQKYRVIGCCLTEE